MHKEICLIIAELHDCHSISDFGIEHEVEGEGARHFDNPNGKVLGYERGVLTILINFHCIQLTAKHESDY